MKVTHSATYDASVADVYAMLTDPAFYALIDDVQSAMESDPEVNQTLHQLVKELAEGS